MTLAEALRQPAIKRRGRKRRHPLDCLFAALCVSPAQGMAFVAERGGLIGDDWERTPTVEEITWGEVIAIFQAAKTRLNPEWCDVWILHIQESFD